MKYKISLILLLILIAVCCVFSACQGGTLTVSFDTSHTVYEGESLEELKAYVTVYYGDGASQPVKVTDFQLQGTLVEGQCTLTVRYKNIEKQFTVNVERKPQGVLCKVTLNYNGATSGNDVLFVEAEFNKPIGPLPSPRKEGYDFDGWYRGQTRVDSSTVWIWQNSEDVLTAQWTPHAHSYTKWQFSAEEHWLVCPDDGEADPTSRAPHAFSEGKCLCGYISAQKGTRNNPYSVEEALLAITELPDGERSQEVFVTGRVANVTKNGQTVDIAIIHGGRQLDVYSALCDLSLARGEAVLVSGRLYKSSNGLPSMSAEGDIVCRVWEKYALGELRNPLTVSDAYEMTTNLAYNAYSSSPVYVEGVVNGSVQAGTYSGYRFVISDKYLDFTVYYADLAEGVSVPVDGDNVVVRGYLCNYRYDAYSDNLPEIKSYGNEKCEIVSSSKYDGVLRVSISADNIFVRPLSHVHLTFTTVPRGFEQDLEVEMQCLGKVQAELNGNDLYVTGAGEVHLTASYGYTVGWCYVFSLEEGWTSDKPITVGMLAGVGEFMRDDSYSADGLYVAGFVEGDVVENEDGYTFVLSDGAYGSLTVSNALWQDETNVRGLRNGDRVMVYGWLYRDANGSLSLRSYAQNDCEIIWHDRNAQGVEVYLSATTAKPLVGDSVQLTVNTYPAGYESDVEIVVVSGEQFGYVNGDMFYAVSVGEVVLRAVLTVDGKTYTDELTLSVTDSLVGKVTVTLTADKTFIEYSDNTFVTAVVTPADYQNRLSFEIVEGRDVAELLGTRDNVRSVYPLNEGFVTVVAKVGDVQSNAVTVQIVRYDPYTNVGASGFYYNYKPAVDLEDSYWRTKNNLMSGDISEQDQAPSLASDRPVCDNLFVRNFDENFADNGNSYKVVDASGNVVNTVYKFGAYVTLEEVAAYVYAFGTVPANYISNNKGNPSSNAWGEYLRLNHNVFSGKTSQYPFEPELPNISGCGGTYTYYEIDIGTTGTDCDPGYPVAPYNDGYKITRGAARIVYARYDGNGNLLSPSDRYVFYTYNHYNDFQEYLNYQGGWGEMFGNITGGGTISSKKDYNPTPYVPTAKGSFGMI